MTLAEDIAARIRDVPDFPVPGIVFKDLTPLWLDAPLYRRCVRALAERHRAEPPDAVLGVEARGFLFAAPLAVDLGIGFIPARKPGRLPAGRESLDYDLEYGRSALEVHRDAIRPGGRILIVDDLLATGGTAQAALQLVQRLGGRVAGFAFAVELAALGGRQRLLGHEVFSLARI
jgi:adenine phosphoribosyltransferase